MSGSGISWAICKSAPRSRQTTTPSPHHSVFYRPAALPAAQPTVSKDWRRTIKVINQQKCFSETGRTVLLLLQPFNGPFSGTTRVSRYQKGKTNLDFTEARDSEWQWHQLGHMQVAPSSRQITTPVPHHSVFLQAGCPSCRPTNSVKALKDAQ